MVSVGVSRRRQTDDFSSSIPSANKMLGGVSRQPTGVSTGSQTRHSSGASRYLIVTFLTVLRSSWRVIRPPPGGPHADQHLRPSTSRTRRRCRQPRHAAVSFDRSPCRRVGVGAKHGGGAETRHKAAIAHHLDCHSGTNPCPPRTRGLRSESYCDGSQHPSEPPWQSPSPMRVPCATPARRAPAAYAEHTGGSAVHYAGPPHSEPWFPRTTASRGRYSSIAVLRSADQLLDLDLPNPWRAAAPDFPERQSRTSTLSSDMWEQTTSEATVLRCRRHAGRERRAVVGALSMNVRGGRISVTLAAAHA